MKNDTRNIYVNVQIIVELPLEQAYTETEIYDLLKITAVSPYPEIKVKEVNYFDSSLIDN